VIRRRRGLHPAGAPGDRRRLQQKGWGAMKYVYLYLLTVPVFFAIDMVWLGAISRDFYRNNLGSLMAESVNWPVAIGFYLLYIVGILALVAVPAAQEGSLVKALWMGALLGVVAYGTYDLTNLATLKGWPSIVAAVDLVWGGVLTMAVSTAAYFIARWLEV
jgi:uncharacterized membrane protein